MEINIDKQIKKLDEMKLIVEWWCNGMFQIGGNLGLFLRAGIKNIEALYNVKIVVPKNKF